MRPESIRSSPFTTLYATSPSIRDGSRMPPTSPISATFIRSSGALPRLPGSMGKRGDFRTAKDGAQPTEEKRNEKPHSGPSSDGRAKVNAALLASHVLATPDNSGNRDRIFRRIRNPLLNEADAADQANTGFMPLLSGDDGDRTEGEPRTWLSVLPSQYRKLKLWRDGKFSPGRKPKFPPLERMDPDEQVEA